MEKKTKHIVIVGASSGLGKALATALAQENNHLYLLSRKIESTQTNFDAIKINCDIRSGESISEAFTKIDKHTQQIDVLINCAGIGLVKSIEDTTQNEIEDIIQTNLIGSIISSQEAYKRMLLHKSGYIINVTSTSSIKARPEETIYCASKAGLRLFTESLRLAAVKNKVRVTAVAPGGMNTAFWKEGHSQNIHAFMDASEIADQIINLIKTPTSISPAELIIERGV